MSGLREMAAPEGAGLRLVWADPASLAENPAQWRVHPARQRAALEGVLAEVGWAGCALYNEATGRLIDGHLRRDIADEGARPVPVLVGSWTEERERLILATLDPIAVLAERDTAALEALAEEVARDGEQGRALLDEALGLLGVESDADAFFSGLGKGDVPRDNLDTLLRGFHFALPPEQAAEVDDALQRALASVPEGTDERASRMSLAFLEVCRGYER
jgi:hypothetical protein